MGEYGVQLNVLNEFNYILVLKIESFFFFFSCFLFQLKKYYNLKSVADVGLLQTAFILSYMILSPVFGFLGDRFNRKVIMAVGILFWSLITLAGSFVPRDVSLCLGCC
jgi:MFS family permease